MSHGCYRLKHFYGCKKNTKKKTIICIESKEMLNFIVRSFFFLSLNKDD